METYATNYNPTDTQVENVIPTGYPQRILIPVDRVQYAQEEWYNSHLNDEEDEEDDGQTYTYDHDEAWLYQRDGWYTGGRYDDDDEAWNHHLHGNGRDK